MTTKQWLLVPLFEQFIKDSYNGKRVKADGKKIKPQTVDNYNYVLKNVKEYEAVTNTKVRIKAITSQNKRILASERSYWKKFYNQFTDYLTRKKGCYDNYVGSLIKVLRVFFNYLKKERSLPVGDFHKQFYVTKEEIPVITLLPQQLQFLITDTAFHQQLPPHLQLSKLIFIFGCTVALRASDLFAMRFSDVERVEDSHYLAVRSIKTKVVTRVKLPTYAVDIINNFKVTSKKRKRVFPPLSLNQFNKNIKVIAQRAGWIFETSKTRSKKGKEIELYIDEKNSYRFCDLLSSHTMRRTAITTMLMLGMAEHIVKKISGHSQNSKAFYRYVNLVQSYLDAETDKVFNRLTA